MSYEFELSIAVVSYHSGEALQRLLASAKEHPIAASHEWIVVDNSSGDGVAEWLSSQWPEVRVISSPRNVGYARAVNSALLAARGEHLLVLNPDIELSFGGVDAALGYLRQHPECGLIGARLLNPDGSVQHSARRFYNLTTILLRRTPLGAWFPRHRALREHLMLDDDLESPRPVDWVMGAWMLVRREAIERTGAMDGRYFLYFEDVDWCYRMWEAGFEVHYYPQAQFRHQYRRSSARGGRTALHHIRSFVSFYDKWGALVYVAKRMRGTIELGAAVASDVLAFNLAFLAAFLTRRLLDPWFGERLFDLVDYLPLLLFSNLVALVALPLLGRYRESLRGGRIEHWLQSLRAAFIIALVVMAGTYLADTRTFSRAVLLLLLPYLMLALELLRPLRARALGGAAGSARRRARLLLIGDDASLGELAVEVERESAHAVVAGAIGGRLPAGVRRLGDASHALEAAQRYRIDEVLVCARGEVDDELAIAVRELAAHGLIVRIDHGWAGLAIGERVERVYGREWARAASPAALGSQAWMKFLVDRPAGLLLCLFALPGFVLCWALGWPLGRVRVRRVERAGRRGRTLRWSQLFWRRSGRALPGLCQLPLFAQVLAGRMSLVGPYPLPLGVEEELGPIRRLRCAVNPGLTGFWQRELDKRSIRHIVEDDLDYLERWSLSLDLDLFLSNLPQLLGGQDRWNILPGA